jgi:hypothetical protein
MTLPSRNAIVAIAALAAVSLALLYLSVAERDYAVDVLKTLFGLSGGTTAGG